MSKVRVCHRFSFQFLPFSLGSLAFSGFPPSHVPAALCPSGKLGQNLASAFPLARYIPMALQWERSLSVSQVGCLDSSSPKNHFAA